MASALSPIHARIDVPLTEEFVNEYTYARYGLIQGQTTNAVMGNTAGTGYPWGLYTQDHVDIRTFVSNSSQYSENWTYTGTPTSFQLGPEVYLNNWNAMVTNVLGVVSYISTTEKAIDLTQFGSDANIIVALPNFQLVYIDPATSYLEVSSDGFQTYASVLFNQSITPLVTNTDSVATWPISLIESVNNGTDLTNITSVRFRFQTYDEATLEMCALRLVGPDWVPTNVDIDNWNGALRQCIPPNAARGVFPVSSNQQLGTLWYVAPTTGEDDPQPIDLTLGVLFNTGSMLFSNNLGVSMRAIGGDDVSQLVLNGQIQAQLDGPQPSLSTSAELPREVSDLEGLSMSQLSGQSVFNLSARQENIAESWINFALVWGAGIPSVGITRSDTGLGYSWTGTAANAIAHLNPNTFYLCLVSVNDTVVRMQVLNVNQTTYSIVQPWNVGVVFDTGPISDSYLFPRRRGRVGFTANLLDGDAQIRSIRPHALSYAKWQSVPMQSNTPVTGARLYASYAPHEQLWTDWSPCPGQYGTTPILEPDTSRTTSGSSTKVTIQQGSAIDQGIISNVLTPPDDALAGIIDWTNTQVYFDVWFPQTGLQNPLSAYLLSQDGAQIPLTLPAIAPGTWQTITCLPPSIPPQYLSVMQSGRYQLVLIYQGTQSLSFWVDNVKVIERTVTWDARANPTDAWTTFGDLTSSDDAGVLFNKGTQLQVRATAHRQDDVVLAAPQVIPHYGQLGNLVWPENATGDPYTIFPAVLVGGSSVHGNITTFDASLSTSLNTSLANAVPNNGFETGVSPWVPNSSDTLTQSTTQVYSGTHSGLWTFNSSAGGIINSYGTVSANQLRTLFAMVWMQPGWSWNGVEVVNGVVGSTNYVLTGYAPASMAGQWCPTWQVYAPKFSYTQEVAVAPTVTMGGTFGQYCYVDSVYDLPGNALAGLASYVWNFGDGNVGSGSKVSHTYLTAGSYNVSCIMTDNYGTSTIYNTIVSIT